MKHLVLCLFLWFAAGAAAFAQTADDQYLRIYNLILNAENLESTGQPAAARDGYLESQTALASFQKVYPAWNPRVVTYRLNYLAAKVALNAAKAPGVPPKPAPALVPAPVVATDSSAELKERLAAAQETLRQLQADKALLEAKLKEALAAQPAAVDPRELARAQEQIKELLKENELLKTTADSPTPTAATGNRALEEARGAVAEANRKLEAQTELAKNLATERDALQARLNQLTSSPDAAEAVRAENELLKKQLADTKLLAANNADAAGKLAEAQARVTALQTDTETLRLENTALNDRLKKLLAQASAAPAVVAAPADVERIKRLEAERDDFARKLTEANQELSSRRSRAANARIEQLNTQIDTLRARVQVFEARAVPYSAEELALFQKPAPQLAPVSTRPERKPISQLPSGVTSLVASAQRHFAAGEYDQAEQNYLEILRRDENNAYTLANLAAIQLQRGSLDEADKNATKAVASAPEDDYSLLILGQVKFRQEKYDEALDALNRAAKLKPQSAEVQNYLGVVLTHKGLRDPAEQALRRAVVLNPGYGDAHHNLAVFYGTKDSSFINLARWHYQRAIAAGHPRNAELEKLFDSKSPVGETK